MFRRMLVTISMVRICRCPFSCCQAVTLQLVVVHILVVANFVDKHFLLVIVVAVAVGGNAARVVGVVS